VFELQKKITEGALPKTLNLEKTGQ